MVGALIDMSRRSKILLGLLTPCMLVLCGGVWLVATTSGLQWLTGVVAQNTNGHFKAQGISGSLYDTFGVQQLYLSGEGWRIELHDAQLQWRPVSLFNARLDILSLTARQVDILSQPSAQAAALPQSIRPPFELSISRLSAGSLRMFSQEGTAPDLVVSDIDARLSADQQNYTVSLQQAKLPYGKIKAAAEVAMQEPYAIRATAEMDARLALGHHDAALLFSADAGGDLQSTRLNVVGKGEGLDMQASAQLAPFSATPVQSMKLAFDGADAGWFLADGRTAILSGTADLHGTKDGGMEGEMRLRNQGQALPLDQHGFPLREFSAKASLAADRFEIKRFDLLLAHEGRIAGALTWHLRKQQGNVQIQVLNVDPAGLDSRLPGTQLHGDLAIDGTRQQQHAVLALAAGDLQLNGELAHRGETIDVNSLRMARGDTELISYGQLILDRRRTFRLSSRLAKLNLAEFSKSPPTDLNAQLEAQGTLLPQAAGELRFELTNSRFANYGVGGNGHLAFTGTKQVSAEIDAFLGDNRLDLAAAYGTSADYLRLQLKAPDLAQLGNGFAGQLFGQAELSGTQQDPVLTFALNGKNLVTPASQTIEALTASGRLQDAAMQMQIGAMGVRAGGDLRIPRANFEMQGSRAQHRIHASAQAYQGNLDLGDFELHASGGFNHTWRDYLTLQWQGSLDKLDASGLLPLHLQAPASLQLGSGSGALGEAIIALAEGQITFSQSTWTPQRWHSVGEFSGLGIHTANTSRKIPVLDRMESLSFGGAWDVQGDEHLNGEFRVGRENGDWMLDQQSGLRMGLENLQLSMKVVQDQLRGRFEANGERLGEAWVEVGLPLTRTASGWGVLPDADISGHVHLASRDFSWLGPLLDDNLQTGGTLNAEADVVGSMLVPRLQGWAQGDGLLIALAEQGVRLEQGKLLLRFERDVVQVDQLMFNAPYLPKPKDKRLDEFRLDAEAGKVSASGMLDLQGRNGNLQFTAQQLPLSQRDDRWVIASAAGQIRFADRTFMLDGRISADAGLIDQPVNDRPRWSDDMKLVGQTQEEQPPQQIKVNATLDLGEHFYIRASGLEGRLAGTLDVRGEPGAPLLVTGIIEAQDAIFDAYGQRLQVERGMVNFQGQLDDPGLNILALRKGLSVEAGVAVEGTARHPLIHLVSTPNVPDAEKLSWIVLGRVPDSTGVDTSLLLAAAGNILGGQSTGQIGRSLGVDELSMRQSGGADVMQSQVVTVGKRLSSRAYLSYEQGFASTAGVTKFSYILTPRITIVTRTGAEDAMDMFYSFRFH